MKLASQCDGLLNGGAAVTPRRMWGRNCVASFSVRLKITKPSAPSCARQLDLPGKLLRTGELERADARIARGSCD